MFPELKLILKVKNMEESGENKDSKEKRGTDCARLSCLSKR